MKWIDPHESYNPNFYQEDYEEFIRDTRTLEISDQVKTIIDSGMVAKIDNEVLSRMSFDVRSRVDYPAPTLQLSWTYWYAALAIAILAHAKYSSYLTIEQDGFTRFMKSEIPTEALLLTNTVELPPELGRAFGKRVLRNTKKVQPIQESLFEF